MVKMDTKDYLIKKCYLVSGSIFIKGIIQSSQKDQYIIRLGSVTNKWHQQSDIICLIKRDLGGWETMVI